MSDIKTTEEITQLLIHAAATGLNAQNILDEAYRLTGLPISLLSPASQRIADAGMEILPSGEFQRHDDDMIEFKRWGLAVRTSDEPIIDQSEGNPYRVMCFDVSVKGVQIGKLAMAEARPFTEEDSKLLKIISQLLVPILYFENKESSNVMLRRFDFLKYLLRGEMSEREYQTALAECNILDDIQRKLVIIKGQEENDESLPILENRIRTYSDVISMRSSMELIISVPNNETIFEVIKKEIEVYGLYVGVSNTYKDLRLTSLYYQQAMIALSYAKQNEITMYKDCFIQDVFASFSNKPYAQCSIRDEIYLLSDYDAQNNTAFVETFKKYLENKCNMSDAAKSLYLHYNTMKYRMNLIRNMIQIDNISLKDTFELLVSIYLIEKICRR